MQSVNIILQWTVHVQTAFVHLLQLKGINTETANNGFLCFRKKTSRFHLYMKTGDKFQSDLHVGAVTGGDHREAAVTHPVSGFDFVL